MTTSQVRIHTLCSDEQPFGLRAVTIYVRGEVDCSTAPGVLKAISLLPKTDCLFVDLTQTTFCDSSIVNLCQRYVEEKYGQGNQHQPLIIFYVRKGSITTRMFHRLARTGRLPHYMLGCVVQ